MPATLIPSSRFRRRRSAACLFVYGLCCATTASAADPAPAAIPRGQRFEERLVIVEVNRQVFNETVLALADADGMLHVSEPSMRRWRLRVPPSGGILYQGERFFPLTALPGTTYSFDPRTLTLSLQATPDAFDTTVHGDTAAARLVPPRPPPGGFFNYDLFLGHASHMTQRSGLLEAGFFNSLGVGTTNALVTNPGDGTGTRATRLETTWTVDQPDRMQSLRFGDSINRPGAWGRSVRFGGIQVATNFATQPTFVPFPFQRASGVAVVPSTVDVFVNNALVRRENVPPGPFTVGNIPVLTGAGEVRLVVRDLFGREQIVTRPFYASQTLLREGLENVSYEFGFVRENFGIRSNDYRDWLGIATYRRGLTERLTGEAHVETTNEQTALGAGGDYLVPGVGIVSAYAAGSNGPRGSGSLALFGFERNARPWSIAARTQWTTRKFTQVGLPPEQLSPVHLSTLNVSYVFGAAGSLSAAAIVQNNRDQPDARFATLTYSVTLGRFASFSITGIRDLTGASGTTIFALLTIPFDSLTSLSINPQTVRGGPAGTRSDVTATLQRNMPLGAGYGYRLLARTDGSKEAFVSAQTDYGTYGAGVAEALGETATRVEASGGVATLGGRVFLSRRIDQSFAVAEVPGYTNVRILVDNQAAVRTDSKGTALIPRLRPYDRNMISVDQRDLPMDAEIRGITEQAVPYYRSGVMVKFAIRRAQAATLTVLLENGKPLPVGAIVQRVGDEASYPVGHDGFTYVTALEAKNTLKATWRDGSCEFEVPYAAGTDPLPDLGTFVCRGSPQ